MSAKILGGLVLARKIRSQLKDELGPIQVRAGRPPGLAVILAGDDPGSKIYVEKKEIAAAEVGIHTLVVRLPADVAESDLLREIERLNIDPEIDGILVQLPLPQHINENKVFESINPLKDVDGFHPENAGLLALGRPRFPPCTPSGVIALFEDEKIETRGARITILGRSQVVGKSLALLLLRKGPGGDATVTVCHSQTKNLRELCREADILVAAVGRREMVRGDWIKPGAVVIDVGIHRAPDGKLRGDVAFDEAKEVAGMVTVVPGGMGPLTVAMLLRNTVNAYRAKFGGSDIGKSR